MDGMTCAIAVNYWYDMQYGDARFSYFNMVQQMKMLMRGTSLQVDATMEDGLDVNDEELDVFIEGE